MWTYRSAGLWGQYVNGKKLWGTLRGRRGMSVICMWEAYGIEDREWNRKWTGSNCSLNFSPVTETALSQYDFEILSHQEVNFTITWMLVDFVFQIKYSINDCESVLSLAQRGLTHLYFLFLRPLSHHVSTLRWSAERIWQIHKELDQPTPGSHRTSGQVTLEAWPTQIQLIGGLWVKLAEVRGVQLVRRSVRSAIYLLFSGSQ